MQPFLPGDMGNCVVCRESVPEVESPVSETDIEAEESKEIPITISRVGLHRHSLTVMEHTSNGNSKNGLGTETGGSLHRDKSLRVLYSRIQPLTRSIESKQKEVSELKLQSLFDLYKDSSNPDFILAEGVERLLNDLNLSPDEFKVLVLAWRLNAEHMCQFTRTEFTTGLKSLKADTLPSLNQKLSDICQDIQRDPDLFKDLYRFTFRFGLDKKIGQRVLPTEMAICLWRIVFTQRPSPLLERWLDYLATHPVTGVPRDTWDMFLHLSDQLGDDLSLYDDSLAWPSVFDDFVEYENDRMNQNVAKDKEPVIQDCT